MQSMQIVTVINYPHHHLALIPKTVSLQKSKVYQLYGFKEKAFWKTMNLENLCADYVD